MTFKRLTRAALLLCAGFSTTAFAHNPMCECKEIPGEQIQCKGGFSDGSGAPGCDPGCDRLRRNHPGAGQAR